jgi:ATP-dependent Clp protease ATP-binding subunit ClpB
MVRLDMSEFSEAHMVQRLIGSPPGYVGYEEGGQLTNPVRSKPYSLVLLDEIEKGHPRVFDIFLQVLDDGRLTDGQGKKVDFCNTVIIATSNAGIEDILDMISEGKTHDEIITELKEVLQDYFRIEFINRFDDIVIFNALTPDALYDIAVMHVDRIKEELIKKGIDLKVSPDTLKAIAKEAYDPRYGARGLFRIVQEKIENVIAEGIMSGKIENGRCH